MLGEQGVLHRTEEGRMGAEQKQRAEQQPQAVQGEPGRPQDHDPHFQQLDQPDDAGAFVLVGELPGGGREQEEGQDQHAAAQVDQHLGADAGHRGGLIGDQQHQGILEQVVVERAQQLGDEERAETPGGQQAELVGLLHLSLGHGEPSGRAISLPAGNRIRRPPPPPAAAPSPSAQGEGGDGGENVATKRNSRSTPTLTLPLPP